jgi:hypothetical protein
MRKVHLKDKRTKIKVNTKNLPFHLALGAVSVKKKRLDHHFEINYLKNGKCKIFIEIFSRYLDLHFKNVFHSKASQVLPRRRKKYFQVFFLRNVFSYPSSTQLSSIPAQAFISKENFMFLRIFNKKLFSSLSRF